ncbi:MAG: helix-turn-helix transcriptional regulator [Lachnospiraceae bacterium]|nr:helix-turn-helix transcriptional regulator [Lachnospiraceae bacterium]
MLANFEQRDTSGAERVWTGRYRNLHNLPHWHLENELICVEQGIVTVSHNHQEYTLTAGESIFLASGEIHYIKSDPDSITAITLFDVALTADLTSHYQLCCAKLSGSYPILDTFSKIQKERTLKKPFFEQQTCVLITELMIHIFREEAYTPLISRPEHSSIDNYKHLLDEIDANYSYITFSDAAAFMGLSEPYFSRFFRKISGMTFSKYLNTVRLEHAIHMLQEHPRRLSVTEIASRCGFETIRHFNRVFRDITGMSPRELPSNYVPDFKPIRRIEDAFNPTLQSSELLTEPDTQE